MNVINGVTLKTLKRNRTRTIVTIIGVILSAAMITAVTTFISSMQTLMVKSVIALDGRWQASISGVPYHDVSAIADNSKVTETGTQHTLGYAKLNGGRNSSKPYIYVQEFDVKSMELYSLKIKEGRLPERDGELAISDQIGINGGITYSVGDTVTLDIGDRIDEQGAVLTQTDRIVPENSTETLVSRNTRTYTIVGVINQPSFEPYNAPGYTAIAFLDASALHADEKVNTAFCINNPDEIFKFAPALASSASLSEKQLTFHDDLLMYMGISLKQGFNAILYSFGAILIGLIMVGSISLIYNAFAISISERSRQFGMLSGVGATSRQIRNSVFFEAAFISIIGIPIGILSGIVGIGLTLYLLRGVFDSFTNTGVPFEVSVSVPSIAAAAVVGFITILLSAWIPARRAARISPIEAIRQTNDVKIKRRQVKTSGLTRKLFGMEGDIALKNFKRNKRRYRATVISLFISIVLFISASSFASYLRTGVQTAYLDTNYDILLTTMDEAPAVSKEDTQKLLDAVQSTDNYERFSVVRGLQGAVSVDSSLVRPELMKGDKPAVNTSGDGSAALNYFLYAVDEAEFQHYTQQLGLDTAEYTDASSPKGIVIDKQRYYDGNGKLQNGRLFTSQPKTALSLHDSQYNQAEDKAPATVPLTVGAIVNEAPLGIDAFNDRGNFFTVVVSDKVYDALFQSFPAEDRQPLSVGIKTSSPNIVDENLQNAFNERGLTRVSIYNVAKMLQTTRNLLLVVNVFAYGFITLITLITVANVFNTISTNVNLRRREFAMLKSVGMTNGGFNRMINFECIFYGLKALLYGLPVALLVNWLIHASLEQGIGTGFLIPWISILICIFAVFLIVFITMMYSMSKVRKENIVDALKNENL